MSPILFDILFDDVDQIFDSQCNPVIFNSEISLNHLLYPGKLLKGFVFKYEGTHIELVREFKYLGITVTASGGLYNAREKLKTSK